MATENVSSQSILIVDDLASNRRLISGYLTSMGYVPVLAEDGEQALAILRRQPIDLVLLDVVMPKKDGFEVLGEMKADEQLKAVPVVMTTGLDDQESAAQCIQRGADDYLVRPFSLPVLQARVRSCLDRKAMRDRERAQHRELASSHAELARAEKARDSLMHMIVHDLNNPLMAISGYATMCLRELSEGAPDSEKLIRYLAQVRNASGEMGKLVAGILDTAKLESGTITVSWTRLPIERLTRALRQRYDGVAASKRLVLEIAELQTTNQILCDDSLLARVFDNLLSNAFKHARKQVSLTVEEQGDEVHFTVSDDGPGVDPEFSSRIFEKYFQIETTGRSNTKRGGVGLGLAFCKMVMRELGGRIWVESEVGKGANFHVVLPMVSPMRPTAIPASAVVGRSA